MILHAFLNPCFNYTFTIPVYKNKFGKFFFHKLDENFCITEFIEIRYNIEDDLIEVKKGILFGKRFEVGYLGIFVFYLHGTKASAAYLDSFWIERLIAYLELNTTKLNLTIKECNQLKLAIDKTEKSLGEKIENVILILKKSNVKSNNLKSDSELVFSMDSMYAKKLILRSANSNAYTFINFFMSLIKKNSKLNSEDVLNLQFILKICLSKAFETDNLLLGESINAILNHHFFDDSIMSKENPSDLNLGRKKRG